MKALRYDDDLKKALQSPALKDFHPNHLPSGRDLKKPRSTGAFFACRAKLQHGF
jgi:hypothetical protein